jgi:hypothetical protein
MGIPLRWASSLGRELLHNHEVRTNGVQKGRLLRKYQYERLDTYKEYNSSGMRSLNLLDGSLRLLQSKGVTLGQMQEDFINSTRTTLLPKMFGDDLVSHLRFLHKRYKFRVLNNSLNITFPRRSGKTVGAAIMTACILVSQPRGNCIMFNLTGRQARQFLDTTGKYLRMFEDDETYGWKLKQHDSRQCIEIVNKTYGSVVSIKSYASGSKGNGNIDYITQCEKDCPPSLISFCFLFVYSLLTHFITKKHPPVSSSIVIFYWILAAFHTVNVTILVPAELVPVRFHASVPIYRDVRASGHVHTALCSPS